MDNITKSSIIRLSRKAGIKSMADDGINTIRQIIDDIIKKVIYNSIIVNDEHTNKTLMAKDIYNALILDDIYIAQSNSIGTKTYVKNVNTTKT